MFRRFHVSSAGLESPSAIRDRHSYRSDSHSTLDTALVSQLRVGQSASPRVCVCVRECVSAVCECSPCVVVCACVRERRVLAFVRFCVLDFPLKYYYYYYYYYFTKRKTPCGIQNYKKMFATTCDVHKPP